jgi:hypothetical protein
MGYDVESANVDNKSLSSLQKAAVIFWMQHCTHVDGRKGKKRRSVAEYMEPFQRRRGERRIHKYPNDGELNVRPAAATT